MEVPSAGLFITDTPQSLELEEEVSTLATSGDESVLGVVDAEGNHIHTESIVVSLEMEQPYILQENSDELSQISMDTSRMSGQLLAHLKAEPIMSVSGSKEESEVNTPSGESVNLILESGDILHTAHVETTESCDSAKDVDVQGLDVAIGEDVVPTLQVKHETEEQPAPQQFIILNRATDGSDGTFDVNDLSSKYIKFEGADGLTYVLPVQCTDENQALSEPNKHISTQPSQQIVPVKNLKSGKKRSASSSSSLSVTSAHPSSSGKAKASHNASVDGINQAWFTTRDDKATLQSEGLKWKQGQWTKEEVDILEQNITNYCKDHDIQDPAEVIFERSKEERKDFYRTVALGIHRPLFSVYRRVTRMYDRKNHRGKYTPSEISNLRCLRAKHGNDWAAIGVALGRSASSVKDKCRLMKDNCNAGKWYPDEEARLALAVHKLTGVKPSESVTSGLSWAVVAEQVGTRSEKQCRTKWLNYLNWKQQGGADWTREDDNLLVEKVSKMDVSSDSDIDWAALSQDWASVRSPQWLRGKWWALKRHIPFYNKLSYPALLEQMRQAIYWNVKPKPGNVRQIKVGQDVPGSSQADFHKLAIPVSVGALADGSLSLICTGAGEEDDGYQAFEVLQRWTPQMLGHAEGGEGAVLGPDAASIIVHALGGVDGQSLQLSQQQQVIISSAINAVDGQALQHASQQLSLQMSQEMSQQLQELEGQVQPSDMSGSVNIQNIQVDATTGLGEHAHSDEQGLNVLTTEDIHGNTFTTEGEEIVTVAEFHTQGEESDQDMMTQDVFETVTSESGGDLVMGVTSPTSASSLMTSLKDPILMSSSDVD